MEEPEIEICVTMLNINPKIIIHRISGDAPKNLLIAPDWNTHKKWVLNNIHKIMEEKNLYQGMYYKNPEI